MPMSQDLVKSAVRTLDILEVFASERKPMTASQLGQMLGYPKSSMSGLLKSLVAQGYLASVGRELEYFPTLKLARLGDWIPAALLGSEAVIPLLQQLRNETGETVTLTIASDLHMRCVHAIIGTHPISLQVEEGISFPMMGTAIGTMYLAASNDATVEELFERWTKHHPGQPEPGFDAIRSAIAECRETGFSCAFDAVLPDTGAIATSLRTPEGTEPLIVAVAGLNRRISENRDAIQNAMQRLCGQFSRPG
ncbi:MAG: helix-turn-helix domain-containing protein [Sphingomonadaceae bacterium]|nr:helix-turn-helix domain-containing protein [Sphingomonadaceae bacterium]